MSENFFCAEHLETGIIKAARILVYFRLAGLFWVESEAGFG